jgi:hypothetical protein
MFWANERDVVSRMIKAMCTVGRVAHFSLARLTGRGPHSPHVSRFPLTAGRKPTTLMWLAHGHEASPPGGRSSWLLRNMLAVSDCVCFVGRLTECKGSWGAAVWKAGHQGSAGKPTCPRQEEHNPPAVGCSQASASLCPLPRILHGTAFCLGVNWALFSKNQE